LGNAFVIEDRRRTLGADIDRNAGADDEGFGMVYLDLVAADQLNDVRPKWHSSLKATQCRGKVLGCHRLAATSAVGRETRNFRIIVVANISVKFGGEARSVALALTDSESRSAIGHLSPTPCRSILLVSFG
jgi:hypothetical protein